MTIGSGRNPRSDAIDRAAWIGSAVALFVCACAPRQEQPLSVAQAWQQRDGNAAGDAAPTRTRGTASSAHGGPRTRSAATDDALAADPTVATVNGRAIQRRWLADALIESHGLDLLLQQVLLELVQQAAARDGVSVSDAEIDAEYDRTLRLGMDQLGRRTELTPQRRAQLVEQWRLARGVSERELRIGMERQALLRKVAGARLVVNEQMLRDEFARVYGTKVECRHIVLSSLRDVDRIRPYIDAGEDFATLARRYSQNDLTAADGGKLPPFSAHDETVPGVLREAAFRMEAGQVSNPIKVNGQYHILKLERRLEPTVIRFEQVRDACDASLRERLLPVEMEKLMTSLQQAARLKIDDPILRRQYEERRAAGRLVGPPLEP